MNRLHGVRQRKRKNQNKSVSGAAASAAAPALRVGQRKRCLIFLIRRIFFVCFRKITYNALAVDNL